MWRWVRMPLVCIRQPPGNDRRTELMRHSTDGSKSNPILMSMAFISPSSCLGDSYGLIPPGRPGTSDSFRQFWVYLDLRVSIVHGSPKPYIGVVYSPKNL